ncbi:MAG: peptidoglycan-associated lipoprotein Pal [Gammaproteobacteria bacterium]|nr:peptidoglycan-associated lipoprotein Pal [Gammaproteobacteria bacterium]
MKNITITSGLLALIMAFILSGCTQATKPDAEAGADDGGYSETDGGATVGTIDTGSDFAGTALEGMKVSYEKDAINDPENVLSIRTIYFNFDSSEISEEDVEVIKHHGKYLALNSSASLRLEGHTDERGTREYNIALADRRAQSVKKLLLFQGASSSQVTIISYGEEKPAALGHDEASWKLNRRAELVYE